MEECVLLVLERESSRIEDAIHSCCNGSPSLCVQSSRMGQSNRRFNRETENGGIFGGGGFVFSLTIDCARVPMSFLSRLGAVPSISRGFSTVCGLLRQNAAVCSPALFGTPLSASLLTNTPFLRSFSRPTKKYEKSVPLPLPASFCRPPPSPSWNRRRGNR